MTKLTLDHLAMATAFEEHEDRFWRNVEKGDDCWVWIGVRNRGGYGRMSIKGRRWMAHRVAYESLVGPIPEGMVIDHKCRNRACVNPAHLEPVTNHENILRGHGVAMAKARYAKQTHCKRGHEYTSENTYRNSKGHRSCRECLRARGRSYFRNKFDITEDRWRVGTEHRAQIEGE